MRFLVLVTVLVMALSACGGKAAAPPTPTARVAQATSVPATPVTNRATPASIPSAPPATPTANYQSFVNSVCRALSAKDSSTLTSSLMDYQYNSGVRYGMLGDGEGQTGDPSILTSWLAVANVRCRFWTPDRAGHGTLLTSGWKLLAPWSLIEFDTINGNWKINDFTFGSQGALWQAIQTSQPVLTYRAG